MGEKSYQSPSWMMQGMNTLQPFARHVGIDLRGGNIRMAQQQLHNAQVSAMIEQMRRKSVAQCMRRQRLGDTCLPRITLDQVPESLACHGLATGRYKQRVTQFTLQ